jgi:hypothetical protein
MFQSSLAPKAFGACGTDIFFLHHFPALRTGLSLSPSGTSLQRTLLIPTLTRMGSRQIAAGQSGAHPEDADALERIPTEDTETPTIQG